MACIDQAIAIKPSAAMFHVNRAAALLALGQLDAALAACQTALRLQRNSAEAAQVMGHVLSDLGRPEEALAAYRDALRHKPDLPDLYNNVGLVLRQADRLEEAAVALRQAVKRAPRDAQAQGNLAGVLKELGRPVEAQDCYRAALRLHPDDPVLHVNLGIALLLAGRFDAGWEEYEWRFRAGAARIPPCTQPRWNGEELAGRTLLIRAEQGIGDTIQFCRYVTMAAARGPVALEVQPGLRHLVRDLPARIVEAGDVLPVFDLWCPLLSLPHLLGMQAPAPPYLTADADRVAAWRDRIGAHGRRIGIAWQGNPASAGGTWPLDPAAGVPAAGPGAGRAADQPAEASRAGAARRRAGRRADRNAGRRFRCRSRCVHRHRRGDAVPGSGHHVGYVGRAPRRRAGASGVGRLAACSRLAMAARGRGLPLVSDHAPVPPDAARRLGRGVRPHGGTAVTPRVPVSWGELIDKITILEIKTERLRAPAALANAAHELALLRGVLAELADAPSGLAALHGELAAVNRRLWDIEDAIRRKEAAAEFDAEFIELARAVYRSNDERSRIKRAINELLGSDIIEEKQYVGYRDTE